jgi:hypothetical protein
MVIVDVEYEAGRVYCERKGWRLEVLWTNDEGARISYEIYTCASTSDLPDLSAYVHHAQDVEDENNKWQQHPSGRRSRTCLPHSSYRIDVMTQWGHN